MTSRSRRYRDRFERAKGQYFDDAYPGRGSTMQISVGSIVDAFDKIAELVDTLEQADRSQNWTGTKTDKAGIGDVARAANDLKRYAATIEREAERVAKIALAASMEISPIRLDISAAPCYNPSIKE